MCDGILNVNMLLLSFCLSHIRSWTVRKEVAKMQLLTSPCLSACSNTSLYSLNMSKIKHVSCSESLKTVLLVNSVLFEKNTSIKTTKILQY